MKKTLLSVLFCCLFAFVFADNAVSVQEARTVSKNFIAAVNPSANVSESDFVLKQVIRDDNNEPTLYIFSIRDNGFIVVSATDAVSPILAYSLENKFEAEACSYAMNVYKNDVIAARGTTNAVAAAEWNYLKTWQPTRGEEYLVSEVKPLLTSTWNQVTYYNNHCPMQADAIQNQSNLDCDGHVPAGCVATDMSVIMHYYRHPETGEGGVNYRPIHFVTDTANVIIDTISYPRQQANFTEHYNYNSMPNSINDYTGEVAKLMWYAGISVQMDYGPDGSGANSEYALTCMKNYWKYDRTAQIYSRTDYSNAKWTDTIKSEIDARRPIYYSANDGHGGHAFVLDGYQVFNEVNTFVHYNDTLYAIDHIDTVEHQNITVDTTYVGEDTLYTYDTTFTYTYDTVLYAYHTDSTMTYDTTFNSNTMAHVNWGWSGSGNGYFKISFAGHLNGYTQYEQMMVNLKPADQQPKATEGNEIVTSTRGSISDGAGNLLYNANTDRTWMLSAPEASRYTIKFLRLETEANADEVIFYKNGDLTNEVGRYSGNTCPNQFSITADSVLVRFVSNGNDVVGRGFVFDFSTSTPASYCEEQTVLPAGMGTITDKGDANVEEDALYRPETKCTWRINGFDKLYISYPRIELALGDFIDIFDVTQPGKRYPLYRIDNYNWPTQDVLVLDGVTHKAEIRFIADNWLQDKGCTLTYETVTNIEENNGLNNISIYPNPVSSMLNVDLTADFDGQINFRIMDMTGRTISVENLANCGGDVHHTINVSNLSKGMYMLSIEGQNVKSVRKFIVE
ncbi:MAG: C10 family peptidase [Bacteroidales bacterium]|nr:C10 family peptidase [Bacteroidales bacterium]